jgi:hypothetical protein
MTAQMKGRPAGYPKPVPTEEEILHDIMTRPAVPLTPHASWATGLSRTATYSAAARNEIATVRFGRAKRALTAPLRKKLQIEGGA